MNKYFIYRYFQKEGKQKQLIASGLSLAEAQKHCQDPATAKAGKWFDGYTDK